MAYGSGSYAYVCTVSVSKPQICQFVCRSERGRTAGQRPSLAGLASPALFRSLALLYGSLDRTTCICTVSPFQISLSRPGLIKMVGCVLLLLVNPETYRKPPTAKQNSFFFAG